MIQDLATLSCHPCSKPDDVLSPEIIRNQLSQLDAWALHERTDAEDASIQKTFTFENYHETMAFVNAAAYVAHREDHHPDLTLSYNRCHVRFSTHDVDGISMNDFICAAKLDQLYAQ